MANRGRPQHPPDEGAVALGAFLSAKSQAGIGMAAWAHRERGEHRETVLLRHLERGRRAHSRLPPHRADLANKSLLRATWLTDVALLQRLKRAMRTYKTNENFAALVHQWRDMFTAVSRQ